MKIRHLRPNPHIRSRTAPGPQPHGTTPKRRARLQRGDVPGWVMVTLMTAGLVVAIWAVAGDALVGVFQTAITRVTAA